MITDQQNSRLFVIRHQRQMTKNEKFLFEIIDQMAIDHAHDRAETITATYEAAERMARAGMDSLATQCRCDDCLLRRSR